MRFYDGLNYLLAATMLLQPVEVFARGFGGGGGGFHGGGGGGGFHGAGGGGFHDGGGRSNFGGGGFGGGSFGGGGSRPNFGGGTGSFGGGNRGSTFPGSSDHSNFGGNGFEARRPTMGGYPSIGDRPGTRPNFGGEGNHPNFGNNTNIGNRTNIGNGNFNNIHNNNFNNVHNNINIATQRPYYGWQHGNWNGNWNRPGGGGYWNGWAHGYANGYNRGYWNGGWGGYWHGGFGGYWGMPWYASPITWGLGAWALGSIMYNSGYMSYSNPYCSSGGGSAYYDYSQPITVINQQPTTTTSTDAAPSPAVQEGTARMDLARAAFKNGDYVTAGNEIDTAIKSLPNDAALHEFRALVSFATKDYKQAAATLYAVLSAGPGWDWTTLSSMYADVAVYTQQLRDLEDYVKQNPTATDARFVLAYHYLTCGYTDTAAKQYKDIQKQQPDNQLVSQLLTLVGGAPAASTASQPVPAPPDAGNPGDVPPPQAPTAIDAKAIVGNWTAKRSDGSTFNLKITGDGMFNWGFSQGKNNQQFSGKYSVDGAILVLERSDGSQMPGLITINDKGFNFKLYGGPPDDAGLDFQKS